MKDFWGKPWFIKVVSLLIAILLVVYIDSTQPGFITQGEPKKRVKPLVKAKPLKFHFKFPLIRINIM